MIISLVFKLLKERFSPHLLVENAQEKLNIIWEKLFDDKNIEILFRIYQEWIIDSLEKF